MKPWTAAIALFLALTAGALLDGCATEPAPTVDGALCATDSDCYAYCLEQGWADCQ